MARAVDQLHLGDHVCWIYDDDDQRLDSMATLVADGIEAGHKIMYFTESLSPAQLLAGLTSRGVAVRSAEASGQVQVLAAQEAYLHGGRFDPERMVNGMGELIRQSDAEGYRGLRLMGDMAWILTRPPGVERLAWYEAQGIRLLLEGNALGVCLYDRRTIDRSLLRRVVSAHPSTRLAGNGDWVAKLRVRRTPDQQGLRLVGTADITNRQALTAALETVLDELPDPTSPVLMDLTGLRLVDAAAARLLARAAWAAPAGLHLNGCQPPVVLVLSHLGVPEIPGVRMSPAAHGDDARP